MIGVMLAVLHSLGMFIIDVFKSRRRGCTIITSGYDFWKGQVQNIS